MKEYEIHTINLVDESSMYKTSKIEYLRHGWLKIINANLWLKGTGDWSDITYTRIFPREKILFIHESNEAIE